ncbi:MAG: hypothetical protein A3J49_16040 [Gallionellales bacterium RIFCSPHIGHO2_02_FULL_57_16]|nr:MAG: hypothetical protein A3J49_16040 [Gallionellales bacterium RIFCSPHIGHO2_02_FULL_57_16]
MSKEHREENTGRALVFSLNKQEREKAALAPHEVVATYYSLNCHMGVWDEGVSGSIQERNTMINLTPRASSCFFFPYHPAMLFDAARELQKRADENRQMKRSNLYTRIGLWVAAGALAVSALVEALKNV